ncbi:MAG: SAM-dependent methyltransferase [Gammaproteobacteria bacterium]
MLEKVENNEISLDEVPYPEGYFEGQAPVMLDYVCARNGFHSPGCAGAFDWCEIGCGAGLTASVLAGANPEARFTGIDVDENAIIRAQALAEDADLSNVRFVCTDIASIDLSDAGSYDYITLHGVYSWVSEAVRQGIVAFVDACLRPGGVLYISYNVSPGWAALIPLRERFQTLVKKAQGSARDRALSAVSELRRLQQARAPYFSKMPEATRYLRVLEQAGPEYALHELFAPQWNLFRFSQVHCELSAIGLQFVGNADPVDDLASCAVPPTLVPSVLEIDDVVEREETKDFINNRFFRRDVYQRRLPGAKQPRRSRARHWASGEVLVTTPAPAMALENTVPTPIGSKSVAGQELDWTHRRLAEAVVPVSELAKDAVFSHWPDTDIGDWVALLISGRILQPCARALAPRLNSAQRASRVALILNLNEQLLARAVAQQTQCVVASPVTGSAVILGPLEAMLLCAHLSQDPIRWVCDAMDKGQIVCDASDNENSAVAKRLSGDFSRSWLPKLAALGVV